MSAPVLPPRDLCDVANDLRDVELSAGFLRRGLANAWEAETDFDAGLTAALPTLRTMRARLDLLLQEAECAAAGVEPVNRSMVGALLAGGLHICPLPRAEGMTIVMCGCAPGTCERRARP